MLTKHQHWRAITIVIFLLILFIAFTLFVAYFICRRSVHSSISLIHGERKKNYATIVNSRMLKIFIEIKINFDFIFFEAFNGLKSQVIIKTDSNRKHLDDYYNFI
jgi:hypothetical protein